MSFQADRKLVPIVLQRLELAYPIDDTSAHRRPTILAVRFFHGILAMTVTDAVFWQEVVAVRIRRLAALRCISRISVQH